MCFFLRTFDARENIVFLSNSVNSPITHNGPKGQLGGSENLETRVPGLEPCPTGTIRFFYFTYRIGIHRFFLHTVFVVRVRKFTIRAKILTFYVKSPSGIGVGHY